MTFCGVVGPYLGGLAGPIWTGLASVGSFLLWSLMWAVVTSVKEFSEPPPPPSYYAKFKREFVYPFKEIFMEFLYDVAAISWVDVLFWLVFLVTTLSMLSVLWRIFKRDAQRVILTLRGVGCYTGEAYLPGSEFVPHEIPNSQVPLYAAGVLMDTFLGYGVRMSDVLVLPNHLISAARGKQLIAVGVGGKKILLNCKVFPSTKLSDIAYMPLTAAVWTNLGTRKATIQPVNATLNPVSICGPKGLSTGQLHRTKMFGLVNYTGSTLPGYSGAGYYYNGALAGVHLGTTNQSNIGITANVINRDISSSIVAEASVAASVSSISTSTTSSEYGWDDRYDSNDSLESVYSEYMEDPDARTKTYDEWFEDKYGAQERHVSGVNSRISKEQFASELLTVGKQDPELRKALLAVARSFARVSKGNVTVTGHSDDEQVFQLDVQEDPLEKRIRDLEKRVQDLEALLKTPAQPAVKPKKEVVPPKVNPHKCGFCNRTFVTVAALQQHSIAVHGKITELKVTGETAVKSDSQVVVATQLSKNGQRSSQKVSSKIFGRTSPVSDAPKPGTSRQSDQSEMENIVKQLQICLQGFQKVISGLTQDRPQS